MRSAPTKSLHASPRDAAPLRLQAGPLRLRFEPTQLWARHWMCNRTEVLRAVYPAVRDANWNTLAPSVHWRRCEIHSDQFSLELKACYGGRRPGFEWDLQMNGAPDGTVVYAVRGVALRTWRANRIGFCVLHPAEMAGHGCQIEHTDGTCEHGEFPREISPQQPFFDLRGLTHSPVPGLRVEVRLHGEAFEMEDQRNWTDASFKTYCRPLQRGWPFEMRRGATIEQRVEVRVFAPAMRHRAIRPTSDCVLSFEHQLRPLPVIGAVCREEQHPLSSATCRMLETAGLSHLRVDLDTDSATCVARWTRVTEGRAILHSGITLEVALGVGANKKTTESLARHIAAHPPPPGTRWLVFDRESNKTTAATFKRIAELWSRHGIDGPIGGGVRGDFVDLNRHRPLVSDMAFITFGVDAQVHAFDETSILETLSTYPTVIAQARQIGGGLPVTISPVRFGAPRTATAVRVDPRQNTAFGGVWLLASLAALVRAKADRATFELPCFDQPTPALRVLQACAAPKAGRVRLLASSEPRSACGLGFRTTTGWRFLVANLLDAEQGVRLRGLPPGESRSALLSAGRVVLRPRAMRGDSRLTLPPYAVMQIDVTSAA